MEFRILGPVEVRNGGRRIPIKAGQVRAVLAVLLIHYDRVVPIHVLAETLWGAKPPPTARAGLQLRISQLRHALCMRPESPIVFQPPGYSLRLDSARLDLREFTAMAGRGADALATGDAGAASEMLHAAMAMWRGDPLENVDVPGVDGHATRLNKWKLAVLADRIEADLRLGRRHLAGELEALVLAHPMNERLCGQLMLAFYRDGRPGEALATFRALRGQLRNDLGIDPGNSLRQLERAILRREPELDTVWFGTNGLGGPGGRPTRGSAAAEQRDDG